MDGLRTLRPLLAPPIVVLTLASGAGTLRAETDLAMVFSSCAGRYSATVEHAWLVGAESGPAEARRNAFSSLVDALSGDARQAMAWRVAAKAAQAALWSAATFRSDAAAGRAAQAYLAACDRLLPGA